MATLCFCGLCIFEVISEDELVEESVTEEIWFDGDDFDFEGNTVNWDSPPCPAPLGIAHIIKIGACDFCLDRISGKRFQDTHSSPGSIIRQEAFERDEKLESSIVQDYCPLCEELFEDIDNIVERVFRTLSETQFSTMQFGIHLPKDLIQEEDRIRSKFGAKGSYPLKGAIVEAIHKRIRELDQQIVFVKEKPDIMVLVDGLTLRVDVDVRPVFFMGDIERFPEDTPDSMAMQSMSRSIWVAIPVKGLVSNTRTLFRI